ncbi:MAG: DNA-directed RNA polymerase subunit beta' [Kiritimatiellae bacterium]|nr:DNA-directed RNA polymerase subunit beta' [Kiritimatiellia bacterium]
MINPYTVKEMMDGRFDTGSQYDVVSITLASPETIRTWSKGEVKNPETINYRTYRPERDGLFCERIFGPTHDWECACGKYKRIKHKGVVCDRCGVEVTVSRVRRQRMGHIELAVPVSHIWFFKCTPSRIGLVLDKTAAELERVLYYEDYMVIDPGDTPLQYMQLITEQEKRDAEEKYGSENFEAKMGAEAVRYCLQHVDLDQLMEELEESIEVTRSKQTRKKITKRMKICEGFRMSGAHPEWMILDCLPVIPPELRPLVPLEGGRFATSDLNDLYRRVINRNNRLKNLLSLKTPDVIIRNEKRMLQEAVDAVFDNGRHGRAVAGAGNRPLKSLSDMLKGKTGRFRQNLLGKRVDYSGRSVIVVGPELKIYQCGLPKKMALVLFEPFIIRRLKEKGICHTIRTARKMIERHDEQVWDILEEVTKGKTVMLNRAPTLHRLSIQSFEPVLIEGEAIRLHPMVCTPFNADFDGDQMAVHVPLSVEAQLESRLLMLASSSIFSPASGKSIVTPTQDICLGIYYLTTCSQQDKLHHRDPGKYPAVGEHLPLFNGYNDVDLALAEGAVKIHTRIRLRNPDYGMEGRKVGDPTVRIIETTVGRVIFNEIWPDELGFVNQKVDKSKLGDLILKCHAAAGHARTVVMLDKLKALGYKHACLAGVSMGLKDMIRPKVKDAIIKDAYKEVAKVETQFQMGVITEGERKNKIVQIWSAATENVSNELYKTIDSNITEENPEPVETNPVFMMADSKARGSKLQIRQLAGMRGLMSNPSGEIIERPITSNFREGLSILEYFISSHGARKGLADTALKTADAGYLTRKLVDVSQDVIITTQDCNTVNGIEVEEIKEGETVTVSLRERVLGRTALYDIKSGGEVLVKANEEIDEAACDRLEKAGITGGIWIRSGLTCDAPHGMCAKCYGRDLSTGHTVEIGTAVGIIAAQSIGEPGTQLTMRTFHIGGTANAATKTPEIVLNKLSDEEQRIDIWMKLYAGKVTERPKSLPRYVRYHDLRTVVNEEGVTVVLNKNGELWIVDSEGLSDNPAKPVQPLESFSLQMGTFLHFKDGQEVHVGDRVATWDPHSIPVLTENAGVVKFDDFVEDVTIRSDQDPETGVTTLQVLDTKEDLHPQIRILKKSDKTELGVYLIPVGAVVMVKEGQEVSSGMMLAKTPRKEEKTRDITGGLPRVSELFEARTPKDAAEISKIEGVVSFGERQRGRRTLIVTDANTNTSETHLIPMTKQVVVFAGDNVKKGQPLTEGSIIPQEILDVCGPQELQKYLVSEVQSVYRQQSVDINDKHIEIIVRQMLRKVRITNPGDTEFLWGDQVTRQKFLEVNEEITAQGKRPAEAQPALLGITKAALETDSFIAAASFQDTTRVLTDASTTGRVDELRGFKENVILGHLIPGGTGFPLHRHITLKPLAEPISEEEMAELRDEQSQFDDVFTNTPGSAKLPKLEDLEAADDELDDESDQDEPPFPIVEE